MRDPFNGTWKLNPEKSNFDANHRPLAGTLIFESEPDGSYLMTAEGLTATGETCRERPAKLIPDGKEHEVPDFPGLVAIATRPDPLTIASEVRREDGSVVGGGSYVVSSDGATLTGTTFGYDTQLRQFRQQTVWDRR
jgi:hypothetical protein